MAGLIPERLSDAHLKRSKSFCNGDRVSSAVSASGSEDFSAGAVDDDDRGGLSLSATAF